MSMEHGSLPLQLIILFVLTLQISTQSPEISVPSDVQILSAVRNVDLTTQIVKVKTDFELKNGRNEELSSFVHAMSAEEAARLSWMSAYESGKESGKLRISRVRVKGASSDMVFHKIEFLDLLMSGSNIKLSVDYALTEYLVPSPKEILQSENQLVIFSGTANVLSAYPVMKENCVYKIGSSKPISFTEIAPSKHSQEKISYGPYENTKAYAKKPITIHYENNAPFLVASSVERIIEVSHWGGNIAVEENVEILHKGAKLKGSFSRLDFQMDRRGSRQPVIKNFKTILPAASNDIYYRDEIGNISTSNVYPRADRVEVELRPRFPLYGGWRTNYVLGYNVPSTSFLRHSGSNFAIKMKLMDRLYDNAVVEKLCVKIILPETSKNIKLVTPYSVKRLPDEVHKTYLDTFGRPVIVLEKENLINNHIQPFTLYYEFDRFSMLYEPLLIVTAFGALFLAAVILFRLDFSIAGKDEKEAASGHQKKE
ncbi:hypothetical protein niasHT_022645 [Heterodera trifolii]|uniref:Dolichyl-diphosphooligosaccharide--protein glycosyltransferase subunit 1 n=1 Tax=Heterodera trifolii TaxID=157864 RepID=A0ABD2JRC6_9BILA